MACSTSRYLPPGRYFVEFDINQNIPVDGKTVENVEVAPGAVAVADIRAHRLLTITGRVRRQLTGKGLAGVPIRSYRIHRQVVRQRTRDKDHADGRYSIVRDARHRENLLSGIAGGRARSAIQRAPRLGRQPPTTSGRISSS